MENRTVISKQKIRKLPDELGDLYKHILEQIIDYDDRPRSISLLRWVCFAERPLSVTELRCALQCNSSMLFAETDLQMEVLCVSLSGGLVEVLHSTNNGISSWHTIRTTVQFIHQSVKDFFQNHPGLDYLSGDWPTEKAEGNSVKDPSPWIEFTYGMIHSESCRSCVLYICQEVPSFILQFQQNMESGLENADSSEKAGPLAEVHSLDEAESLTITDSLPSLRSMSSEDLNKPAPRSWYAIHNWHTHANKAENYGFSQKHLIKAFGLRGNSEFKAWVTAFHLIAEFHPQCPHRGATLLHSACQFHLKSVFNELVKEPPAVETLDDYQNTPLHIAAANGHADLVENLLDHDAVIGSTNRNVETPLACAAARGHVDVLKLLIKRGADLNAGYPLYRAAEQGHTGPLRELLKAGANPNFQGGKYNTALQAAASTGDKECVQLLLEHGADVNSQGGEDGTALHAAVYRTSTEIVQMLLDAGADINAIDEQGQTPYDLAEEKVGKVWKYREDSGFWGMLWKDHEETAQVLCTEISKREAEASATS